MSIGGQYRGRTLLGVFLLAVTGTVLVLLLISTCHRGRRVFRHHHPFRASDMRVLLVFGVVMLFLHRLPRPTGSAGRANAWWDTLIGRVGDRSESRDVGAAPRWIADNKRTLLASTFALGILTLLVWTRPTGLVALAVIVVVALLMAATSIVSEIGRRAKGADAQSVVDSAMGNKSSELGRLTGARSGQATKMPNLARALRTARVNIGLSM
jgi:hypothetical protein